MNTSTNVTGLRVYAVANVYDAIKDVLPYNPVNFNQFAYNLLEKNCGTSHADIYRNGFKSMKAGEVHKAVNAKFGTTYAYGTIVIALGHMRYCEMVESICVNGQYSNYL